MSLTTELQSAFSVVGADVGLLRDLLNGSASNLNALTTVDKTNIVNALNELKSAVDSAAVINDGSTNLTDTWSSSRISLAISTAIADLVDSAPDALNTLNELATALNNNSGIITSILNAQAKRVAVDQAQAFTALEKSQACSNIGVGDPDVDLTASYTAARDA